MRTRCPILFALPTVRPLEKGDMIICEMHPKYGGYPTHVERTFCLGEPEKEYLEIYAVRLEGVPKRDGAIYPRGQDHFRDGRHQRVGRSERLGICELGIHGHGISSLEYPRYRLHAPPGADAKAIELAGDSFRPGMVFAFNIDLVNPAWRQGQTGCVFAETVLITEDKPRCLHHYPFDLQRIGQ